VQVLTQERSPLQYCLIQGTMSRQITQPVNQVRLTNVAVVRINFHGKRFEVACYRNKILNYRQGIETDLSEVLQTDRVFTNVSKGLFAPSKDLQVAFDTTDQEAVCQIILQKGQIQVSDMERNATYENTAREVANMLATKCVHPMTNRSYTTSQIRNAMKEAEISIQPTSARSVKQQFLDCVKTIQDKGVLEIQRAKMELGIVIPPKGNDNEEEEEDRAKLEAIQTKLQTEAEAITVSIGNGRTNIFIDPSRYRAVDAICKQNDARLEIVRQTVTQEGDSEVTLEMKRKENVMNEHHHYQQSIENGKPLIQTEGEVSSLADRMAALNTEANNDNDLGALETINAQISTRKKNKKAAKKSKKAKRREKEESALRQGRIDAEKVRREEREARLGETQQNDHEDVHTICPGAENNTNIGESLKSCNTCGGLFNASQYRTHFRSDWHRYNLKLKMKDIAPIGEREFELESDVFFDT